MIHAGITEIRAAHRNLSAASTRSQGSPAYLLLFYAAECGLKYAQMKRSKLITTAQLDKTPGHDLSALIKELRIPATVLGIPPTLRLSRHQRPICAQSEAHQAWRYGVGIEADDEARFVVWLKQVCEFVQKEYL
jgi:hypothetical protein